MKVILISIFIVIYVSCFSQNDSFITTWKTDNAGTSCSSCVTIPTAFGSTYDYDIDWDNDGAFDDFNISGDITHDYGSSGTYQIAIRGDFPRIFFNNEGDKEKILSVDQWGDIVWLSMNSAFRGCENLAGQANDSPNLSQVTDMSSMFSEANDFNQDIGNWNVSTVTDMSAMFFKSDGFNQDIGNWDVSSVVYMNAMFGQAFAFNQDISNWDVSSVTSMNSMFEFTSDCRGIGNWNVSSVTSMIGMFSYGGVCDDITEWDVSSVTNMAAMFSQSSFNQDISVWDVSSVSDMSFMFEDASYFNQNLGNWNISSVTDMEHMLSNSGLSQVNYDKILIGWESSIVLNNIDLGASNLVYCNGDFARSNLINIHGWNITGDQLDCSNNDLFVTTWKTDYSGTSCNSCVTIPTASGSTYDYDIDWENDGIFDDLNVSGDVTHDYGSVGTYQIAIRGDFPRILFNDEGDKEKILTIDQWGDIEWQSMNSAFLGCRNLTGNAVDVPDLTNVGNFGSTFRKCSSFNQDISNWDMGTASVTSFMFRDAVSFNQDISNWDVSGISNMQAMFLDADSFNHDISNWDVSTVSNMSFMFRGADSFDQNLGDWDISSATNLVEMLNNSGMSQSNYDSTLIGWEIQSVMDNVTLGALNLSYCGGEIARTNLINDHDWNILGDQQNCPTGNSFLTTWKTDNPGSSCNSCVTIPTFAGSSYSYDVDWENDGVFDDFNVSADITHDYGSIGTFQIAIQGTFPQIYFNNIGDKGKILSIDQWGDIEWQSMNSAFQGCSSLIGLASDTPDLSNVTDMSSMFLLASSFNQDIGNWDVSTIVNFSLTFDRALSFNQNLGDWDISSVQNMGAMLNFANLNQMNYDSTLIGWANQDVQSGVSLGALDVPYCLGKDARNDLLVNHQWSITQDVLDCSDCSRIVVSANEFGLGTINYAIECANESPGLDLITFDVSDSTKIVLDSVLHSIEDTHTIIDGTGVPGLSFASNSDSRLLEVNTNNIVEIKSITLEMNNTSANDIILNNGSLILEDVIIIDHRINQPRVNINNNNMSNLDIKGSIMIKNQ